MKKWLTRSAWACLLIVCAVLVIQAFVCDVYRVDSGSMEPVLHGPDGKQPGESVLVFYGAQELRRFELAVLRRPGEDAPIVKRIVALPGESVLISGGDLLIDGKRLACDVPRAAPITVFDSAVHALDAAFPELARGARDVGGAWRVEAPAGGELFSGFAPRMTDGFWNASNEWVDGSELVNDLGVQLAFRLLAPGATLTVELTEDGDRFQARIAPRTTVGVRVDVLRSQPDGSWTSLGAVEEHTPGDRWHTLSFANLDNTLLAGLGRGTSVFASYPANAPLLDAPDPNLRHRLPRVALRITGAIEFRALRVERDRCWLRRGTQAVDVPLQLGPDEVFVLGDNSSQSFDSREYGPVKVSDLLGRPGSVLWPRAAIRRLDGPRPWTETR